MGSITVVATTAQISEVSTQILKILKRRTKILHVMIKLTWT